MNNSIDEIKQEYKPYRVTKKKNVKYNHLCGTGIFCQNVYWTI